jgi:hypothetical protein
MILLIMTSPSVPGGNVEPQNHWVIVCIHCFHTPQPWPEEEDEAQEDPAFWFTKEDERLVTMENRELNGNRHYRPELDLWPLARPCTLQEYLVCCAGLLGGLKD